MKNPGDLPHGTAGSLRRTIRRRFVALSIALSIIQLACAAPGDETAAAAGEAEPSSHALPPAVPAADRTIFSAEEVNGFDVSHHQGEIDWQAVPSDHFVFLKATEGVDYVDPLFRDNWRQASNRALLIGAYHMFRPEDDVEPQVAWFVQQLRAAGFDAARDLPPTLDIERNSGVAKVTPSVLRQRAEQFLVALEQQLGVRPLVYTNPTFWRDELEPEHRLVQFPLWLAAYTGDAAPPATFDGWATWTFWQHTDAGQVAGVPQPVDLNRFNGSGEQLRQLIASSARDASTDGG